MHEMAHALGPQKCIALPFVYAFSGCDTVSCFAGHGKKTVWNVWEIFDEITPAFSALAVRPDANTINEHFQQLEDFVVHTSTDETVNEARKHLFSQKGRSMDNLPPTQAALVEHIKREAYQAGHVWAQMLVAS